MDRPPSGWSVQVISIHPLGTVTVVQRGRTLIDATRAMPGVTPVGRVIVSAPALPSSGRLALRPLALLVTTIVAAAGVAASSSHPASRVVSPVRKARKVRTARTARTLWIRRPRRFRRVSYRPKCR